VQLGDPNEASLRSAIDFLAGRSCGARITSADSRVASKSLTPSAVPALEMLESETPSAAQREMPGLF
ncbi:MAG: S41 family peptidase, partial [Sphingopyxis sp.]